MKEKLITLLIILIVIPLVSSLAFVQNEEADIQHPIRVDGGLPSSAECNITVKYPNNTILINFLEMTDNTDYFNYTLNTTQTAIIGKYSYDVTCTAGDLNETETFDFYINPGGIDPSDSKARTIGNSVYIMFALGVLFFIALLFTQKLTFKFTFLLLGCLFFLITINLVFISLQDEVASPKIQAFFSGFTAISFYLYWFIGALVFILWMIAIIVTMIAGKQTRKQNYQEAEL